MTTLQQDRHVPPPRPPLPQISGISARVSSSESSFDTATHIGSFRDIQKVHDLAYRLVDAGLQADEIGDLQEAATSYTESLHLLDNALRVNCEKLVRCTADQIDQAKQMQQKMNKTRQQISFRLQSIQAQLPGASSQQVAAEPSAPPSYEEALSQPPCLPPSYEDDELTALADSLMHREISNSNIANAVELFSIEDGVQIFYITREGYVSAPTYPTSLHIVRLIDGTQIQGEEAPIFLHVGDWIYPLVPATSPVLHTNYGAYLFPDVTAPQPGSAVGVTIPDTLSLEKRQRFEDIIRSSTLYAEQSQEPTDEEPTTSGTKAATEKTGKPVVQEHEPEDTATKISKAAEWIAWGVGKGAEKAASLIQMGSEKFQQRYQPAEYMHKVDPHVQKGVMYARSATNGAVKVTGYIVNQLVYVTEKIAKELAPHVKEQGMKILPQSMTKQNTQGKSTIDGVVEVASSGFKGFGTVYIGLESAAKTLGRCLADETVHVVTHKYGHEAGNLAENSMYTAGNVFMTAHNASHLGVKAIAKRAVRETGKAVISDLNDGRANKNPSAPSAGSSTDNFSKTSSNLTNKKRPPDSGEKR